MCFIVRDHPAVIKRRFTSVLIVSGLSPLFVWAWREFTGIKVCVSKMVSGYCSDGSLHFVCVSQMVPSLLAIMGIRFEGLVPAIVLPLLLTMVRQHKLNHHSVLEYPLLIPKGENQVLQNLK